MKQNLLASLSIPLNSNHDANNSGHSQHNQVISNSSTTSGIELSSKNSTNGVNSANGDGSSENIPNMNHTVKVIHLFKINNSYFSKLKYY